MRMTSMMLINTMGKVMRGAAARWAVFPISPSGVWTSLTGTFSPVAAARVVWRCGTVTRGSSPTFTRRTIMISALGMGSSRGQVSLPFGSPFGESHWRASMAHLICWRLTSARTSSTACLEVEGLPQQGPPRISPRATEWRAAAVAVSWRRSSASSSASGRRFRRTSSPLRAWK